jgi:hypothetical protein
VEPPQERQAGCDRAFEQDDDEGKRRRGIRPFIERLIVFEYLPRADALPDQQNENIGVRDLLRELRRLGAAGAHSSRREKNVRTGILALDGGFQPLRHRLVSRMIAEKPPLHSDSPVQWARVSNNQQAVSSFSSGGDARAASR